MILANSFSKIFSPGSRLGYVLASPDVIRKYTNVKSATNSHTAMLPQILCAEFFNGSNDNRVFLYGDGSNTTYYSGIDEYGKGRADYFPDLNEIEVGDNSPITAMCRHWGKSASTVDGRMTRGLSLKQALTAPVNAAMSAARRRAAANKGEHQ